MCQAAPAEVLKWKDKDGQVHYGELPPLGAKAESKSPPPPPSANPNQDALNKSLSDSQKPLSPQEQKIAAATADFAAKREAACKQAQERLTYLTNSTPRRLASKDEATGQMSRMTEETFNSQVAEAEDRIKNNCE